MQRDVVIPAAGGREFGALMRVVSKMGEPLLRSEPRCARQNLRRIKVNGAVEDRRSEARRWLNRHGSQARLIDRVPIFQRRFQVAFEKIDRAEKFPSVSIARSEAQRDPQGTPPRGGTLARAG